MWLFTRDHHKISIALYACIRECIIQWSSSAIADNIYRKANELINQTLYFGSRGTWVVYFGHNVTILLFAFTRCQTAVVIPAMYMSTPTGKKTNLGLYTLSGKTYYCQISPNLEGARCRFTVVWLLWNLTDVLAAVLSRRLSNVITMRSFRFFDRIRCLTALD